MTRTRRAVLGTTATLLIAGCTTGPPATDDTTTSTTTTTTTTQTTTTAGHVTVQETVVQPALVSLSSPDTIGVTGGRNDQYVVATLAASAPTPDATDYRLVTDPQSYAPNPDIGGMGGRLWQYGEPYDDDATGWIAFALPKPIDTDAATLTWPGGQHALHDDQVAALNRAPTSFTLESFTAPDQISVGEDATLTLELTNTGDTDGTWIGALNRSGPSVAYVPETAIAVEIPAGETTTYTYTNTADERYGNGATGEMKFLLEWRNGSQSRTVTVTE